MGKYVNIQIYNTHAVELFKHVRIWILYDINKEFIDTFEEFLDECDMDGITMVINKDKKSYDKVQQIIHTSSIKEIITDEKLDDIVDINCEEPNETYDDMMTLFGNNSV
jgi:hypothetical protein